jgi:4-amino-4-deoxy-L-arabinose transferase-like glycosyltransferase
MAAKLGIWNGEAATKEKFLLLVFAVVFALASHVIFLRFLPSPWQRNESADYKVFYEPVARQLAAGHGFYLPGGKPALKYPPGIPVVYASTFWLSDRIGVSRQTGLRTLQASLTVATSVLAALIAWEIFGVRAAFMACFLWSTYPFHLWLSKQPSAEPLVCVLLGTAVFAFVRWLSNGRRPVLWGSICGVVVAFAALTKPFNIVLAAVFLGLAWICDVQCTAKKRALFSAVIVLAFTLSVLPWEVWASRTAGHPIPLCTNGTATLLDGITFGIGRKKVQNPPVLPAQIAELANDFATHRRDFVSNREVVGLLIANAKKRPSKVALLFFIKAIESWYGNDSHHHERWAALIQLFYIPFFALGAWATWDGERQHRNFVIIACGVTLYYWGMTTFVALSIVRYMVPAISLLMILAGRALDVMVESRVREAILVKREVVTS